MIKIKCPVKDCERNKRPIEGFTQKHAESLLAQHMIKHENEKNDKKRKDENK